MIQIKKNSNIKHSLRISVHVHVPISPMWEEYRGFHTKNDEMVLQFGIQFRPFFTHKYSNIFPAAWVSKFNLKRRL